MAEVNGYKRDSDAVHPPHLYPDYRSTVLRSPRRPLIPIEHTLSEVMGPLYGHDKVGPNDDDLTRQLAGEPLGERIIVAGRVPGLMATLLCAMVQEHERALGGWQAEWATIPALFEAAAGAEAGAGRRSLGDILATDERVSAYLTRAEIEALLVAESYLGSIST